MPILCTYIPTPLHHPYTPSPTHIQIGRSPLVYDSIVRLLVSYKQPSAVYKALDVVDQMTQLENCRVLPSTLTTILNAGTTLIPYYSPYNLLLILYPNTSRVFPALHLPTYQIHYYKQTTHIS